MLQKYEISEVAYAAGMASRPTSVAAEAARGLREVVRVRERRNLRQADFMVGVGISNCGDLRRRIHWDWLQNQK